VSDAVESLVQALNDALPQTQCTRCGYPDCQSYATAIATERIDINQCPPGGQEGVRRLAALTGRPELALNPANGREAPRLLAIIDEAWCIGCTLCLKACPVDCIVGGPKLMHTVMESQCTGCELCVPVCPVDCIALTPVSGNRTGWDSWSEPQARQARERYVWHQERTQRDADEYEQRLAASAHAAQRNLGS
jgi:electron transport complex protein RnfB